MQANALHVAYHYIPGTYMYSWLLLIYSTTFTLLQGLTQVEEMLISAIMPIMSIYRLPHGQYGYSGHVINLPQDVSSFATSLPRLPSELDVIVVNMARPALANTKARTALRLPIQPPPFCVALLYIIQFDVVAVQSATSLTLAP